MSVYLLFGVCFVSFMSNGAKISAGCLTPILYVRDFLEAMNYYTEKLLFDRLWEWGEPPGFGAVRLGKVEIFFCLGGQGHPGTWLSIFVDDVDDYFERITQLGADVIYGPTDELWGLREIHVRDPNQHVIRFGQSIPMRVPKMEIERVPLETRRKAPCRVDGRPGTTQEHDGRGDAGRNFPSHL